MSDKGFRENIRVLFVLPSLGAGGSERVVATLANHWAGKGRAVSIATFDGESDAPYYDLAPEVELKRLALPAAPSSLAMGLARSFQRILALRRLFFEERPHVVVSFLTKTNILSLLAARGTGIPVIISERNNPYAQNFNALWRKMRALAYPWAYAFVTMTRGAADYYPERQRPRLAIIPNPVALPGDLKRRPEASTITAVGRLAAQKRFDVLIDAFALIAPRYPAWRLAIWGEGEERAVLERHRDRKGLGGSVAMPGVTKRAGEWIENADIFVLSSDYEGWPNALLEAMTAGLPAISTNCDFGPAEIVDHERTGLLVPRGDARALAVALSRLIEDEALRMALGRNAREEMKRYRLDEIANRWDALVEDAALGGKDTASSQI